MTTKQKTTPYQSFLLRLWQEEELKSPATWRGEIESIQTGQKWEFTDLDALFELLRARTLGEPRQR